MADDIVLITGAARGIGQAIAEQCAALGASLALLDRNAEQMDETGNALRAAGTKVVWTSGDVRDREAFARLNTAAFETFGHKPTVLVSNAGITRDRTLRKMSQAEFDEVVGVHLTGSFIALQSVWEGMIEHRRGSIVLISSNSSLGAYGQGNYAAAKASLSGLSNTAAIEGGKYGIRSNVVSFGSVKTALMAETPQAVQDAWKDKIPLRRFADPIEAARPVVFLASPLASYITGQNLVVDGGYLLPT